MRGRRWCTGAGAQWGAWGRARLQRRRGPSQCHQLRDGTQASALVTGRQPGLQDHRAGGVSESLGADTDGLARVLSPRAAGRTGNLLLVTGCCPCRRPGRGQPFKGATRSRGHLCSWPRAALRCPLPTSHLLVHPMSPKLSCGWASGLPGLAPQSSALRWQPGGLRALPRGGRGLLLEGPCPLGPRMRLAPTLGPPSPLHAPALSPQISVECPGDGHLPPRHVS